MAKKNDKWHSAYKNNQTYLAYYERLRNYALAMFEWEGLPDSINKRFLEIKLFEEGKVVFFYDKNLGYLTLPVATGSPVNVYEEPTEHRAYSVGYPQVNLSPEESVVIYSNYSRSSIDPILRMYAERLYQVERTIDVNLSGQKTPILIVADEAQRLTMMNAYMQYDGFEPFIFGNKKGFDKDAFTVLKTDVPFLADKLMLYKHDLWNEAMTFLGVGNSQQDKKERMVVAEVSANDEQIDGSRYIMLNARQDACEKINDMFPELEISVDFRFNKDMERQQEKALAENEVTQNEGN